MAHVDALSRSFGVLVIDDNPFEWNLMVLQNRDPKIKDIATRLESAEDQQYELRNGLVYKKHGANLLFLVPEQIERHVLFRYRNEMGHVGPGKMIEAIRRTYWSHILSSRNRQWYKILPEIEYAINNMVNRSTGKSPSQREA